MKLIISEKPSVAKNIAHSIGAYDRVSSDNGETFAYRNDEYYVANSIGHLYGLGNPTDYGYSQNFATSYQNGELPMFPEFRIYPNDESKNGIREFLNSLINRDDVTEIICATDAAREGELIFREIYNSSGSTKPCKRFWTSSLTDDAILSALENMKPLSAYENLYQTAKVRNELDWIFGMNLSRLYTALNDSNHRVGRVVTPLLGIVVDRDNEIMSFKSTTSYKVLLNGFALSETTYDTEEEAAAVKQAIGDAPFLLVTSASHLPRAMIFFQQEGLNPLPAPANQLAIDSPLNPWERAIPSPVWLMHSDRVGYETLGRIRQWLKGPSGEPRQE